MKEYKRKSTIYKNTTDCPKLSKKLRRIFEKSNRSQSKSELRNVDVEELFEDDDELEMELSWLCYKAERELGDKYECTCPDVRDEEAVREHMNYLNGLLLRNV